MKPALLAAERRDSVLKAIVPKIEAASARNERSVVVMCLERPEMDYLYHPPFPGATRISKEDLPPELDTKLANRIQISGALLLAVLLAAAALATMNTGLIWIQIGLMFTGIALLPIVMDDGGGIRAKLTRPTGAAKEVWDYCKARKLRPKMMRVRFIKYCEHGFRSNSWDEGMVITANW